MKTFRMLVAGAITAGIVVTLVPTADASVLTASNEEQCTQLTLELPDLSALGSPSKFTEVDVRDRGEGVAQRGEGHAGEREGGDQDDGGLLRQDRARRKRERRAPGDHREGHGQVHRGDDRLRQVRVEGLFLTSRPIRTGVATASRWDASPP